MNLESDLQQATKVKLVVEQTASEQEAAVDNSDASQTEKDEPKDAVACQPEEPANGSKEEGISEETPAKFEKHDEKQCSPDSAQVVEPQNTVLPPKTVIRGTAGLFGTIFLILFGALFANYVCRPFTLPSTLWSYDSWQIIINCAYPSFSIAAMSCFAAFMGFAFAVFAESRDQKGKIDHSNCAIDVPMEKSLAFELCMAGIDRKFIQRAKEDDGEIVIHVHGARFLKVSVQETGEKKSRIQISRETKTNVPCLFWQKELEECLQEFGGSSVLNPLAERLVSYIQEHAPLYANRQPPSAYRIHIDYEKPMKNHGNAGWALVSVIPLYPLLMWMLTDSSASQIALHARYEAPRNPQLALHLYDKALAMAPESRRLYAERGEMYLRMNMPVQAESDYRRALSLGPDNKWLLYGLQNSLIQQGNLAEVIWLDDKISSEFFDTADVLNNRAWDEAITGNPEAAISDTNKAITLDPKFYSAYGTRGYAYHLLGNEEHAIADYSSAISLNPEDRVDHFLRAQSLRRIGQPDRAALDEAIARRLGFGWWEMAVPPNFDQHGDPPGYHDLDGVQIGTPAPDPPPPPPIE